MVVWSTYSFSYFLLLIKTKYLPGDVYATGIARSFSEILGCLLAGLLQKSLGHQKTMTFLFLCGFIGSLLILNFEGERFSHLMPAFMFLTNMGIAGIVPLAYSTTTLAFPVEISATAVGVCNFMARLVTIYAFVLGEKESPVPERCLCLIVLAGLVVSTFIQVQPKAKKKE